MKNNIDDNIFIGYIKDKNDSKVVSVLYYPAIIGKNIIGIEISTGCIFPLFKFYKNSRYESDYIGSNKDFFDEVEYFLPLPYDFTYSKNGKEFKSVSLDNSFLHCIQDAGEIEHYLNRMTDSKMNFIIHLSKRNTIIRDAHFNELMIGDKNVSDIIKKCLGIGNKVVKNNRINELIERIDKLHIGYNLNERNNLTKAVGREKELLRLIKSVGIFNDSVILLGESGVGKTTLVEDLALSINQNRYEFFADKIIYSINPGALVGGTRYRGDFEERFNQLLELVKSSNNKIVLFIDEVHELYSLGSSENSTTTAVNILKPYIESRDITIIGATTYEEYAKTIGLDKAFTSRCNIIKIKELDKDVNIDIIYNYIIDILSDYNIEIGIDNLYKLSEELYNLSLHQNVYEKILPLRIVKRIIKDAVANAILDNRSVVNIDDIINAVNDTNEIVVRDSREVENKLRGIVKEEKNKSKILVFNGG